MRKLLVLALIMMLAVPAMAELQNVLVGGSIQIRADYYNAAFGRAVQTRWPGFFMPGRFNGDYFRITGNAIGFPFGAVQPANRNGVVSPYVWNSDQSNGLSFVEQRTRLNVKADFTDEVAAFIEMDVYDIWGAGNFRSNYITGVDGVNGDNVQLYQAYIEANQMWGTPLRLRVGRQELSFGSEWLVGTNDANSLFTGLSFDGVRLTYATDQFTVDAWASKLIERLNTEGDGDVDFYGVYASYTGIQDMTLDAYWMWVRDARSVNDFRGSWFSEWVQNWLKVDNYDVTNLHTVGLRGAGTIGAFDYEAEVAYQFGDADQVGQIFKPFGPWGDDRAKYDGNWAATGELGYTFDMNYKPRVWIGGAYFKGEDNRDTDLWRWLSPFDRPRSSVSFNRMFSNVEYSQFLDMFGDLSNFWTARAGVSVAPTENLTVALKAAYLASNNAYDVPRFVRIGRYRVPINPRWSFWTQKNDDDLGIEAELSATYNYTSDLSFKAGWAHLFVGDGLSQGNYNLRNGLLFNGGTSDDDADYIYLETKLQF
jgi:hypothetical protein